MSGQQSEWISKAEDIADKVIFPTFPFLLKSIP